MDPIIGACLGYLLGRLIILIRDVGKAALHRRRMARKQRRIVASRLHVPLRIIPESVPIKALSCSHPTDQLVDIRSDAFAHNELVATLCLACDTQLGPEVWSTRKYEELEALTKDERHAKLVDQTARFLEGRRQALGVSEHVMNPRARHRLTTLPPDDMELTTWGSDVTIRTVQPEGRPFMEAHGADPVPIVIWAVAPEVNRPKAQLGDYGPVSDDERAWGFDEETPIRQTVRWRRVEARYWLAGWPVLESDRRAQRAWSQLGWRVDLALDGVKKGRRVVVQLCHADHPPVRLSFQHVNDYRRFLTL